MSDEATQELTVQHRAVLALGLSNLEDRLADLSGLASKSKDLVEVTNADSYQQIDTARKVLKTERIDITKTGKAARDDANAFAKAVIAKENQLIAVILPEEQRLQAIQHKHDDAIAAEKQKLIDAEVKRVEAIQKRIAHIRGAVDIVTRYNSTADTVSGHIDDISAIKIDDSFDEFRDQAEDVKIATLTRLRGVHAAAVEREEDDERRAADRKELDELREAQEKREAEDQERRAKEDREAREKQDKIDADELRLKKDREAFEQEKLDAEAKKEAEEQAEKDRIEAEAQAEKDRRKRVASVAKRAEYPGEDAIVRALGEHFDVSDAVVMSWLSEIRKAA